MQEISGTDLEKQLAERYGSASTVSERISLGQLALELARISGDRLKAAMETSALIAPVSFRASRAFLKAVPEASRVLSPEELRAWGELGRRVSMGDVEAGISFFRAGVAHLSSISTESRMVVLEVCARQMVLSSTFAQKTLSSAAQVSLSVRDSELLSSIFEVALDISKRSAKHSGDFISTTPDVVLVFERFGEDSQTVARAAIELATQFAHRAGGIASEMWAVLPKALHGLTVDQALTLIGTASKFLPLSGNAAIHLLIHGGSLLRKLPDAFNDWQELLHETGECGNAPLISMIRSTPVLLKLSHNGSEIRDVIGAVKRVITVDPEAAILCLKSSPRALGLVSLQNFERWVDIGLTTEFNDARARRSFFALETRQSQNILGSGDENALSLGEVSQTLRLYIEGMTGRVVEILPLVNAMSDPLINDGNRIHLPQLITEFDDEILNFRLYKVLAAHGAGQIEFGTHLKGAELLPVYNSISEIYSPENVLDAFSLNGYIEDFPTHPKVQTKVSELDYNSVLDIFPAKGLARRIFSTLENGRIDRQLRYVYRGLVRDLDFMRDHLRDRRPNILELPATVIPFELLFQITLLGGVLPEARQIFSQIASELELVVSEYLSQRDATVSDTLMATQRIYSLFQSVTPETANERLEESETEADEAEAQEGEGDISREGDTTSSSRPMKSDIRDLFSAWASLESMGDPDDLDGPESWSQSESSEQELEAGEVSYNYDEWDRDLTDHKVGWCRVIEKRVQNGSQTFVELTRSRYSGTISSIKHQFQMLKPESLKRVTNEFDGEDFNLSAVIDYVMDRRTNGQQSERLYIKRLHRKRDVAVSFLLDQSSSTARTVGRHPLQPYTHPGRRIIEVEKEGLVLMSEALEAVGDIYSINGFTSEGRRNVKFYVIKDFNEPYSQEIEKRIGGITYQNNTRLGAAIRHAAAKLSQQPSRTKLLIVLSDGRPYDHDYGDARYAREDTREALKQTKLQGITPFCITIDRDSEAELRDLYGEIGYTIIDDVLSLPERLPAIYRRLTT
jgi:nitric oxide reductase NorD protein